MSLERRYGMPSPQDPALQVLNAADCRELIRRSLNGWDKVGDGKEAITCMFFKGASTFGKLIRWETRGKYSHMAFMIDGSLFESQAPYGVRVLHTDNEIIDYVSKYEVDYFNVTATREQMLQAEDFALKQVGKGYDYIMVLAFLTKATHQDRRAKNKWFCSEYGFETLSQAGINLLERVPSWMVNPTMASYSPVLKPIEYEQHWEKKK